MWLIILCVAVQIALNAAKVIMSNDQVENYKVTTTPKDEITWQISLFDYDEDEGFQFAVRVPQDGHYVDCLRSQDAGDWECGESWTFVPAHDYLAGISKLNHVENNSTAVERQRMIVILGKVESGDDYQYIRSSAWHVSWPKHGEGGSFAGSKSFIKEFKNWKNWPVEYWMALIVGIVIALVVFISCCACCCSNRK